MKCLKTRGFRKPSVNQCVLVRISLGELGFCFEIRAIWVNTSSREFAVGSNGCPYRSSPGLLPNLATRNSLSGVLIGFERATSIREPEVVGIAPLRLGDNR